MGECSRMGYYLVATLVFSIKLTCFDLAATTHQAQTLVVLGSSSRLTSGRKAPPIVVLRVVRCDCDSAEMQRRLWHFTHACTGLG